MKIGGNSNKKCKDRLGKPKIGPETEKIGEKAKKKRLKKSDGEAKKVPDPHRSDGRGCTFGAPGPP